MIFRSKPLKGEKILAQGETLEAADFIKGYFLAVPSGLSSEILFPK